jgi:hypothetical protein
VLGTTELGVRDRKEFKTYGDDRFAGEHDLTDGTPVGRNGVAIWGRFHQHFTYSFYARRSRKHKKILTTSLSSYTLGSYRHKSCTENVDEIDTWDPFH